MTTDHHHVAIVGTGFAGLGASIALGRGRHRPRRARAGRRRRRHLAGQQLPRLPLRRPVPPLLVLVRPEPGLDRDLLAPARDPGLPAPHGRGARRASTASASATRCSTPRWDDDARPLAADHRGGPAHRRRPRARQRRRWPSPPSPTSPASTRFEGTTFHSARWRPRPRPHRRAGGGHRHRRVGHPVRARDPARWSSTSRSSSARRRGSSPTATAASPASSGRSTGRFPAAAAASSGASSTGPASCSAGACSATAGRSRRAEKLAHAPAGPPGARPRAARGRSPPTTGPGCKRLLLSDDWYPALQQPNVDVVTEKIVEVRPHGVVTADGVEHEVDTIIFGTGFHVTDNPVAERVHGVDGADAGRALGRRPAGQAYLGTTVAGFPNLFLLAGPNTGIGHTSLVVMIEAQLAYVVDALRQMAGPRPAPRRPAARGRCRAWTAEIQAKAAGHRLEHRRLRQLVPRRRGPQHHALARPDLPLRAAHPALRRRELRGGLTRPPRVDARRARWPGHRRRQRHRRAPPPWPSPSGAPPCCCADLDLAAAEKTAAECEERGAPAARRHAVDVADRAAMEALADEVREHGPSTSWSTTPASA